VNQIKTVIFGSRDVSKLCLKLLIDKFEEFKVVGYVLHQNSPNPSDEKWIVDFCKNAKIPIVSHAELLDFDFNFALSLAYDKRIEEELISIPNLGIINIHLAPLPSFGGHNSLYHAIRECFSTGKCKYGFTTHYIDKNLDQGGIIYISDVNISNEDTAFSLYHKTLLTLPKLFEETLRTVLRSYPNKIQDISDGSIGSRYFKKNQIELEVDLTQTPEAIINHILALSFPSKQPGYAIIASKKIFLSYDD